MAQYWRRSDGLRARWWKRGSAWRGVGDGRGAGRGERAAEARRAMDGMFIDSLSKIYAKHGVAMPASVPAATGLVKIATPTAAAAAPAAAGGGGTPGVEVAGEGGEEE